MTHIEVHLTKGYVAKVSPEDASSVLGFLWHVTLNPAPYAARFVGRKKVYLHRELCRPPPKDGEDVDHINGDTLDCRRHNLRPASRTVNNLNRKARGVYYSRRKKRWEAYISVNRVRKCLGWFKTEAEAIEARAAAQKEYTA